MNFSHNLEIDARPERCGAPGRTDLLLNRLRPWAHRLQNIPGIGRLVDFARRARTVAQTPSQLSFQPYPGQPVARPSNGLKIVSANLWHDWPFYRRLEQRLEDFATMVDALDADLVLLQEVSRTRRLWVDRWLAKRLGMAYVYARANGHLLGIGFEEGLAIFSRYPLRNPQLQQLGGGGGRLVHRMALGVNVASPWGELVAISAHLGLARRPNAAQLACLQSWTTELAAGLPALVGGDFNAHETETHMTAARTYWVDTFRSLHPSGDGTTHELLGPFGSRLHRSRLDYIFLQAGSESWQVIEAGTLRPARQPHSDHAAVFARLLPAGLAG